MKNLLLLLVLFSCSISIQAQLSWQGGTTPNETDSAVLLFDSTGTPLESYSGTIYAHTGVTIDDADDWQNVIGDWGDNSAQPSFTLVSGNIYSLNLTPTIKEFYNNPSGTITAINIVLRNDSANTQTTDLNIAVGSFQVTLNSPSENSTTILNSGDNLTINASNTDGTADYVLKANGTTINTQTGISSYTFTDTAITENQNYELAVTADGTTITKTFAVVINPGTISEAMPAGMENGINYDIADATKAVLVLDAPNKDFVYVAGSFNNWQPDATYAMKKDSTTGKFWLELTGLTSGQIETYQYWVFENTPLTNSPKKVITADPFSTLVLSAYDDPGIPATSYPNLPAYPDTGNQFEVTVLQTGQTAYNWQVTNFTKPNKEDLVIYEVLIRDFDSDRNYQNLIDRIDYFKNLNVNAIQLMPIMEYEGNESWGYNTAFHMAIDKFYGTENKLKEFIDLCHQNGIAVILDIALNHAYGRNPMVRMWMDDPDGDGYGGTTSENPYFNQEAKHSYSVGHDFNHQSTYTQYYVNRVIKHWLEEFHVDGFRWDLTKGFTQNCTAGDDTCTNSYQQDRVDILKQYADDMWAVDSDAYVIFEHLGTDTEEQEWANYRIDEGKGIMLWGKMTEQYNQLTMGYASSSNINRMGHESRGFTEPRLVGYAESHDEERLMYKNLEYGNSSGDYNVKDLNTALYRMQALGAVSLTIPGPKMIWHFGDLGMENSINTCTDGSVGDCKLSTKPQPQWDNNWLEDANRKGIYDVWSKINRLKIDEPVFEGDYTITSGSLTPNIQIWNDALATTELSHLVIIANFDLTPQSITPNFPNTGTWYNLFNKNTPLEVTDLTATITLQPGEFKIFGNNPYIDPNDLDSDGVVNASDNCPDTPLGAIVDVTGCEIFTLPSDNFAIQTNSETCRSSNNGSINITANMNLNYSVTITGTSTSSDTFTTQYTADNLEAGDYTICITVDGESGYEQCFDVTITEPEDLSVLSKVSNTTGKVSLNMTGSTVYNITFNGKQLTTTNGNLELDLVNGANTILVKGENDCQGIFEKTIYFGSKMTVFPNPVTTNNNVSIYLGDANISQAHITLYTQLGKLVYDKKVVPQNNVINLDFGTYSKGLYILNVQTNQERNSFKIIK